MQPVIILAALTVTQCGGGACPPVGGFGGQIMMMPQQPAMQPFQVQRREPKDRPIEHWYQIEHDGLTFQVWGYLASDGRVRWDPKLAENKAQWERAKMAAERKRQPEPLPVCQVEPINFGLDPSKMHGKNVYSGNFPGSSEYGGRSGKEKKKIFLTVIGSEEDRKSVVHDWYNAPQFADLRDRVNFGEYNRGEWQVADGLGYFANGKPTILVQEPSGKVVFRCYDYSCGPDQLASALRRADPNYSPERDPGPGRLKPDEAEPTYILLVGAGVVCALLYLLPRKDSTP